MNSKLKTLFSLGFAILSIGAVIGGTLTVAVLSKFYFNWDHPIGDEALAMMGKMKYVSLYFPFINWNYQWDGAQPGFWLYLPFPFMVGAFLVKFFNFSYPYTLVLMGLFSYLCIAVGIYGITYRLGKNHLIAILASFLAMTSQGVWYWDGAGYYARTLAIGFYFLAVFAGIVLVQKIEKQKHLFPLPKFEFFLTIILFFITAYAHAFPNDLIIGTLILLFLTAIPGWANKILTILFVLGTGICLSAFYFFLMWYANFTYFKQFALPDLFSPHPVRLFWNLKVFEGYSGAPEVSPLVLPLLGISLLVFLFLKNKFIDLTKAEGRMIGSFFFCFLLALYYPLQGSLFLPKLFYIPLFPCDLPFFVAIFGSILGCLLLNQILRNFHKFWQYLTPLLLLLVVVFLTINGYLFTFEDKWIRRFDKNDQGFLASMVIDPESKQNRVGTTNPLWAESLNYFYQVPQNRGYFISVGSPYNDWQFWQSSTIWDIKYDYPETDFLIDWYGIKWILTTDSGSDSSFKKFNARPDKYDLVYQKDPNYAEFIPKNVSPILSVTNATNLLVIGNKKTAYDLVIRNLAQINLNSQELIPVRGKEFIDEYNLNELKQFQTIYLYDFKYRNIKKAGDLLKEYVKTGGGLIVEGVANLKLFDPLPQGKLIDDQISGDWNFKVNDHEITKGIDFKLFSPAFYNNSDSWKIVYPEKTTGFETLLSSKHKPLMLVRSFGEGRILWMGFNLNYHITANRNAEESKLLKNIISWVAKEKMAQVEKTDYEAKFINPEKREIFVKSSAKAILNKEYNFPVWKAYVSRNESRRELKIYSGGLDQQYILLPSDLKTPYTIILNYGRWPIEKIGFIVSIITLLILLVYLFKGILYPHFITRFIMGRFAKMQNRHEEND